jgi:hypothetical protein
MHRFRIDDIAESARGIADTTLCYFDVELPDRALPGHAIVNVTDTTDRDSLREYIATVLNTMVATEGSDRVVEALASADGLRISPP